MFSEKRRAERVDVTLEVSVLLADEESGTVLAGPAPGEARDFSPLGIALSLANIKIDKYHLFFTCQDNPSHIMKIGFQLPDETEIQIPARPVWYDRDKDSPEKRALLGIEFLLPPKDKNIKRLVKELFPRDSSPPSWWEKLF